MNPLISIIVPIYKAEAYLNACVDSVCKQSYPNIEIVLVNDGSPDGSAAICDAFAKQDDRITIIHQENRGVSAARNAGINKANGDYLMFVDGDDVLLPQAAELLYQDLVRYKADIASAVKATVKPNGTILNSHEDHAITVYEGETTIELSLDGERQMASVCAKLFSRELVSDIRFYEGRNINEDGYFLFECYLKQPRMVQHNEVVYHYYIREDSNSRSAFSDKYLDMLFFANKKKETILVSYPHLEEKALNMETSIRLYFLEVLCRTADKKYLAYQKESINFVKQRYRHYHSINKHERDFAKIVRLGLYPIYKKCIRFRRRMKQ